MSWKDLAAKHGPKLAGAAKAGGAKVASGAGIAAGKIAGGLSGAAGAASGAVGAAGTAVQGAAWGAAAAGGRSAVGAFKDPGFILFIGGALSFLFVEIIGSTILSVFIGTVFMFLTSIYILQGRGLFGTIIFWVWYVFFGGITDPATLLYALLPIILFAMLVHGVINKVSHKGTFFAGAGGELTALVPILFFFLDLGAIAFLTRPPVNLPLTPLVQNMILFTPWWALLGVFTTKKENFFISLARILAIFYVFAILTFGVVPEAMGAYSSAVPGAEDLVKARQEVRDQIPQRENPFFSQLACVFGGEYQDTKGCVQRRQEVAELKVICKEKKLKPKTPEFDECIEEERQAKEEAKLQVTGIKDSTIKEPTKAEFVVSDFFPKKSYVDATSVSKLKYPVELKIENPRKESFQVAVSCNFSDRRKESFLGIIKGQGGAQESPLFQVGQGVSGTGEEVVRTSFVCEPPADKKLNQSYTLTFEALFNGLTTKSRLQRAFIGDKTVVEKETLVPDVMRAHFSGGKFKSQAPADFARLNFAFGNPLENPIVETGNLILSSTVDNVGKGHLAWIRSFRIDLPGFSVDDPSCLQGNNVPVRSRSRFAQKQVHLPTCFILTYPQDLENPEEYVYREFEAEISYDYLIRKEIPIEVLEVGAST